MTEDKCSGEGEFYERMSALEGLRFDLNRHLEGDDSGPGSKVAEMIIFALMTAALVMLGVLMYYMVRVWIPGEPLVWLGGGLTQLVCSVEVIKLALKMIERRAKQRGTWEESISRRLASYRPLTDMEYQRVIEQSPAGTADATLLYRWLVEHEIPAAEQAILNSTPRNCIRLES